jgi:hypothetical protein
MMTGKEISKKIMKVSAKVLGVTLLVGWGYLGLRDDAGGMARRNSPEYVELRLFDSEVEQRRGVLEKTSLVDYILGPEKLEEPKIKYLDALKRKEDYVSQNADLIKRFNSEPNWKVDKYIDNGLGMGLEYSFYGLLGGAALYPLGVGVDALVRKRKERVNSRKLEDSVSKMD